MVKSITVPRKCYAISDGDRQDDPYQNGEFLLAARQFSPWGVANSQFWLRSCMHKLSPRDVIKTVRTRYLLIALFDGCVKKHTSTHSLNFDTFYLTN